MVLAGSLDCGRHDPHRDIALVGEEPQEIRVAVGVVDGPGIWDLERRLAPSLQAAPWNTSLVHGGGPVWLATLETNGRMAWLKQR